MKGQKLMRGTLV